MLDWKYDFHTTFRRRSCVIPVPPVEPVRVGRHTVITLMTRLRHGLIHLSGQTSVVKQQIKKKHVFLKCLFLTVLTPRARW